MKKAGAGGANSRQESAAVLHIKSAQTSCTSFVMMLFMILHAKSAQTSIVMMMLSVGAIGCSIFSQALMMLMPIKC